MSRPPSVTYLRDPDLGFEIQLCRGEPHARHRHFHPERALAFIRGGTSRTVLGETEHLLEPGTLVHFPPGVSHSCDPPDPAAWSYDMLFLRVPEEPLPFGGPGAVLLPREERRTLGRLFRDLGSPRLPRGEREHRLYELLDRAASLLEGAPSLELPRRDPRMEPVENLLRDHFREGISLETLGARCGLSRFHLVRAFRRHAGLPPHAFQTVLRLNEAKDLLRRGLGIPHVAQETGFFDQSHFAAAFRERFGLSPRDYVRGEQVFPIPEGEEGAF